MEYPQFKVCVRCFTYNHSNYITDAMNGFCMQQTNFPFVCCIVDDASTDGEQKIIYEYVAEYFDLKNADIAKQYETDYAHIVYAQHKKNKHCFFAVLLLKENLYSKKENHKKMQYISEWRDNVEYEALCEGDDYWVVKDKLQRQTEILEKNDNITMVYSNYQTVDETKNKIIRPIYENLKKRSKSGDILPTLFRDNFIMTLTTVFRKSVYETSLYLNSPSKMDYMLFLSAAFIGDSYYFNEEMGAYRNSPNGMVNSHKSIVRNNEIRIKAYVSNMYLQEKSKKETFWNDIVIKHWIMINALRFQNRCGEKIVHNIIKIKKIMVLYVLPSLVLICFRRICTIPQVLCTRFF